MATLGYTTNLRGRWRASTIASPPADGGAVSSWTDTSGLGNHATQATGTAQPTYRTNVLNGLPVVRFDGGDQLGVATANGLSILNAAAGISIFAVVSQVLSGATDLNTRDIMCFTTALGNTSTRFKFGQRNSGTGIWALSARRLDADVQANVEGPTTVAGGFTVLTAVVDYANSDAWLWRDRALLNSSTAFLTDGVTQASDSVSVTIGARGDASEMWNGDMAEILVYSAALSSTDRQTVEAYLLDEYWTQAEGSKNSSAMAAMMGR